MMMMMMMMIHLKEAGEVSREEGGGLSGFFFVLFSPFEGRIMITIIVMVIISYMKGNAEAP